jgi:hypothetical protein
MELQFKTQKAENLYWKVKGFCFEFIYRYADAKYYEFDIYPYILKLCEDTRSRANPNKVHRKFVGLFKDAKFAFNLPEHPEKHNGFDKSYQYESEVMRIIGYTFNTLNNI